MKKHMRLKGLTIFISIVVLVVLAAIIVGFVLVGSPANQRAMRLDSQRESDLANLRDTITSYWQTKGNLPETIDELEKQNLGYMLPMDPVTKAAYTYSKDSALQFSLCATFDLPSSENPATRYYGPGYYYLTGDNLNHEAGYKCFHWTIDKEAYDKAQKQNDPGLAPKLAPPVAL